MSRGSQVGRGRNGRIGAAAVVLAATVLGAGGVAGASSAVAFQPIREAFDANRVARHRDATAACASAISTLQIETCALDRTENVDVTLDTVRSSAFAAVATLAAKRAINADDAAWLANRTPVCRDGYDAKTGGTIVGILVATCEQAVSTARLAAVTDRPAPTAHLTATDDTDPDSTQYATTGGGARIGAVDTQGDETGGVVIAWVVIGGYRGFTVDPGQFRYVDGTFVDRGVIEGHARGHLVAAGQEYVFDVDYSKLASDPGASRGAGRYEFSTGGHAVGEWK